MTESFSPTGPPADDQGEIISRTINPSTGQCESGWVCEHRWPQIQNMIKFRNAVGTAPLAAWWDNGQNQIAFCRGTRGFIAFNNESEDLDRKLFTCLSSGVYCDVINGGRSDQGCSGRKVVVDQNGEAHIKLSRDDGVLAIHAAVSESLRILDLGFIKAKTFSFQEKLESSHSVVEKEVDVFVMEVINY